MHCTHNICDVRFLRWSGHVPITLQCRIPKADIGAKQLSFARSGTQASDVIGDTDRG